MSWAAEAAEFASGALTDGTDFEKAGESVKKITPEEAQAALEDYE